MRRWFAAAVVALLSAVCHAERILLVPLDGRPAAGQFAQMIARMAGTEVVMPPYDLLGRFTQPGNPDRIIDWLRDQDFADVTAVVVSTDMIAYGGLVASRTMETPYELAVRRLARLHAIRLRHPKTRFFGFSAIMRLMPTSTRQTAPWRLQLARHQELKDRLRRTPEPGLERRIRNLEARIPPIELERYTQARLRSHRVQLKLVELTRDGALDYLILGQDDAQPFGPHIPEQAALKGRIAELFIDGRVYVCEGIDQHANVLVSRALLRRNNWTPRVRLVYSDASGRFRVANYESKNVAQSLQDQLLASGARPMGADGNYDYTLFLNTPDPAETPFQRFLGELAQEVDQGFPVAVADINLGKDGTGDPRLIDHLWQNNRIFRLLAFAGWNTAGNTMGTTIPAANVYLLSRRVGSDALEREVAQREFLLHRFVNDFAYHKYTRPSAYRMIDALPRASRDETYGEPFEQVNQFVQQDLAQHLQKYFRDQFLGKSFFAGTGQFSIQGIEQVRIFLPWPRAYEVRLEFRLRAGSIVAPTNGANLTLTPPRQ